jgi:hypothetical protein
MMLTTVEGVVVMAVAPTEVHCEHKRIFCLRRTDLSRTNRKDQRYKLRLCWR